ncbi:CHAD domain-containing protein [Rhodovulum euryhalinum]|uniref:CHAD domain-containing protein n=1 Tax=Rhodovulum euryhalinum TaxID=35805 RepID=A0A4R2KR02_9RHOB|nr:CHAD domain-containing protein [Rhodovulum euryhalinum]TCO69035.1 CHAD domain-containing protein [Rhodovulum euryhalinum]
MAYRLKRSDESCEAALRRIAVEELDAALAEIDDPAMDLHDKVHQVRKRAKRLRGLIRLVRSRFPDYAAENAAIRDAARRLSGLRDREGVVETFDKLVAATGAEGFDAIRAHLVGLRDAAAARGHVEDDLAAFRADMVALRERAQGWTLRKDGFKAMRPGLEKVFARARRDRKLAAESPGTAVIHDWRKAVKYHWYHTRLLQPLDPEALDRRADRLRDLSELLGDHHDLAVLDAWIAAAADLPGSAGLWAGFRAHIAARQRVLETEAQALAADLFARRTEDMSRRWKRRWKAWRSRKAAG